MFYLQMLIRTILHLEAEHWHHFENYDLKKMTEKMFTNKILENNPDLLHARNDFLECYEKNDLYTF